MKAAVLILLISTLSFAQTKKGVLVDARCFDAEETNGPKTDGAANTNKDYEIDACHPNERTNSFELVDFNGHAYRLDAAGNAKAAEFVRARSQKSRYQVEVAGERSGNTIRVQSISPAQ